MTDKRLRVVLAEDSVVLRDGMVGEQLRGGGPSGVTCGFPRGVLEVLADGVHCEKFGAELGDRRCDVDTSRIAARAWL